MLADLLHMLLALAGLFAGAGAMFLLLTRHSTARMPGTTPGHSDD